MQRLELVDFNIFHQLLSLCATFHVLAQTEFKPSSLNANTEFNLWIISSTGALHSCSIASHPISSSDARYGFLNQWQIYVLESGNRFRAHRVTLVVFNLCRESVMSLSEHEYYAFLRALFSFVMRSSLKCFVRYYGHHWDFCTAMKQLKTLRKVSSSLNSRDNVKLWHDNNFISPFSTAESIVFRLQHMLKTAVIYITLLGLYNADVNLIQPAFSQAVGHIRDKVNRNLNPGSVLWL